MKKYLFIAALAMGAMPMVAQETYQNAAVATEDLNGTARYVGMGGAMDALGADISTIGTNPAGIGLFRSSSVSLSAGVVSQQNAKRFADGYKTNLSFDQIGLVYATQWNSNNYVNFGFNYHKSRNFDQILSVADGLNGASQNKATVIKRDQRLLYVEENDKPDFNRAYSSCSVLDALYANNLNYNATDRRWYSYDGEEYVFDRMHDGYVGEYDFNLSGNVKDRFFWGVTVGIHDVHYHHYGEYAENLVGGLGGVPKSFGVTISDDRRIKGQGADVKVGVIFRPIEESPLRFGLSVSTPTWYDLKTSSFTTYKDNTGVYDGIADEYKFRLYTPWRFNLSAGHTVGDWLALGLGYEFADYSSMDTRQLTGEYTYDGGEESESDNEMNRHTAKTLKGVSTFKAGIELRPDPAVAVRFGYNYVSPMYEKNGYKDTWLGSMGSYHSSTSDFINWDATHRITCGLGIQSGAWNFGAAYQYSVQKGKFAPFDSYEDQYISNLAKLVDLKNQRHQFLFTVNYTFSLDKNIWD